MPGLAAAAVLEDRRTAVHVRTITTLEDFYALEPAWDRVLRRADIEHPFLEYAWIRTWWECFGRGSRLNVVIVQEGGEAVAIAPLIITNVRIWGIEVRCLRFFYNDHVPRAGFIVASGHDDAVRAIWNHLRRSGGWDLLQLCQLPDDCPTLNGLQSLAAESRYPNGIWESGFSPYVPLDDNWAVYERGLASKHKSNLRNRFKRLNQTGAAEMETIDSSELAADVIDEGFRLESAAWKRSAGTAIACDPAIARFYRVFARRAASAGWLRLNFLRAGDSRIAFDYSLLYKDRVFLLKIGYDPAYSQYSPSNLLLSLALQRAFRENCTEYDFLGDQAEWKRCWARNTRRHVWLYIFPDTFKGRALHFVKFRLIPALKTFTRRTRGTAA